MGAFLALKDHLYNKIAAVVLKMPRMPFKRFAKYYVFRVTIYAFEMICQVLCLSSYDLCL